MANEVEVNVLFFAKSRELTGVPTAIIKLPQILKGVELLAHLFSIYPSLSVLEDSLVLAVNQEYVDKDQVLSLSPGDEVAIIPPISGGWMECGGDQLVRITGDVISQEEITKFVSDPGVGGVSIFLGVTRDNFEGKRVLQLEYEAYTPMALKQLKQICSSIREKWPVCKIAIVHRTGVVPVGETSVMIAVSATHRKEAIQATSFAIDAVKSSLTIWKKEVYAEGGADQWKENKECDWTKSTI